MARTKYSGTNCSGGNNGTSGGNNAENEPSPSVACESQGQVRSSEGCNVLDPLDNEEQYVEANGEEIYLSDREDLISSVDALSGPTIEGEQSDSEPSILEDSEHSVLYDPDNPRIELNALFPDIYTLMSDLRHFALKNQFDYKPLKSDKKKKIHCKMCK
jgi:hypothetical protein